MLKVATTYEWPTKIWSILPGPTNEMVYARFSGQAGIYSLFERARSAQLNIPSMLLDNANRLLSPTAFFDNYEGDFKLRLWNEFFDIEKLSKNLNLGFGFKTDGHMVSVLFEKETRVILPFTKQDMDKAPRNINMENWKNGMYPLYKQPRGISMNDRILGVDPGKYILE